MMGSSTLPATSLSPTLRLATMNGSVDLEAEELNSTWRPETGLASFNTILDANGSLSWTNSSPRDSDILSYPTTQAIFYIEYLTIFMLGVFGNCLVCYVVFRNKHMQNVTNYFITNLALADILLCVLAVPFTPFYTFMGEWMFGRLLCHLVTMAQGTSVYVSTLTLMSIAIDRFFVIIYPFRPRLSLPVCYMIIISIWLFSISATLPYAFYMGMVEYQDRSYCEELWPSEFIRQVFSGFTAIMQFVVPFIIILICYGKISNRMNERVRAKPGSKSSKQEEADRERKRRTNRMLIAMVTIFGVSWLPMNVVHLVGDYYAPASTWSYYNLCFFITHVVAMSSTCYNPFLYAWLNENFRKEFQLVLPCFQQPPSTDRVGQWRSERTCNGNDTQETLLQAGAGEASVRSVNRQMSANKEVPNRTVIPATVETHPMTTFVSHTNGDTPDQAAQPLVNGEASEYV
ncbi:prolactin-releasing peptide receptor-like [Portunus trituberculatus]|uniref:Neuropeptide Y receptor type 2 n=1 Tax=Portunus trituberculatus TaxID=210409 RepID=A0A5B7HFB9_PORTR|nr:prolactin-releasing peptide receptor-like [Portunus trituberculatus]MPC71441.1 Neuropeptide Y receptor type 2 [Portunus trituberculatus]